MGEEVTENKETDVPPDKGGGLFDIGIDQASENESKVDEDGYSVRPQVIKPSISESSSDSDSGMILL